jgi:hypothetical protein
MYEKKSKAPSEAEWERRVLCSDESCIGVIGADGRCKECGLAYNGPLPETTLRSIDTEPADPDPEDFEPGDDDPTDDVDPEHDEDIPAGRDDDPEWEERKLCSDESCIGVIGADGRCKECGQPYRS